MKKILALFIPLLLASALYFTMKKEESNTSTQTLEKETTLTENTTPKTTLKKETTAEVTTPTVAQGKTPIQETVEEKTVEEVTTTAASKSTALNISNATEVKMKIKAKEKDGVVKAKVSISHNMLTYDQAKKKGKEANFITHITAIVDDKVVYDASTSQFLSKNPLMKFMFQGKKGDELTIIYKQLKGETFYASKKIK